MGKIFTEKDIQKAEREAKLELISEFKARLHPKTCKNTEGFFPMAGQEFRDKIIEMFEIKEGELGIKEVKPNSSQQ